jgi:hypothetical protein
VLLDPSIDTGLPTKAVPWGVPEEPEHQIHEALAVLVVRAGHRLEQVALEDSIQESTRGLPVLDVGKQGVPGDLRDT